MYRILLFSSAAIAMSACSMDGSDSFYGSGFAGQPHQSSAYSTNDCGPSHCASSSNYTNSSHQQAAQSGYNGYGHGHSPHYGAKSPDAHAYGSQVYGGHQAQGYHGAPQLRGRHNVQRGYKYATLGSTIYNAGENPVGVQGRLGYQSPNYVGAEIEGSFGITNIDGSFDIGSELGVGHQLAGFATGRVPLGNKFSVLGRAGYHTTRIASSDFDGIAYGAGAEYAWNERSALRLDYTNYDLGNGLGGLDSISVGSVVKF